MTGGAPVAAQFRYACGVLFPVALPGWLALHAFVVLLALATYVVTSLARRQRRHPSAAVAWVVSLALAPYVALPLFLVFGLRKSTRAPRRPAAPRFRIPAAVRATPPGRLQALALGLGMLPALQYRQLAIHEDGATALRRLLQVLEAARHSLDVSTFLIGDDAVGEQICAVLARRARDGVRVRLLVDGVGRYLGGAPSLQGLKAAGVQVRLFASPWASPLLGSRANLRNHRKIAAADRDWVWSGGRNLAAEYFVPMPARGGRTVPPWIDLSFDLSGPLAHQLAQQFELDWAHAGGERTEGLRLPAEGAPHAGVSSLGQFLPSGPDQGDDTVHALLVDACFNARHRVVAVTPYFVPDAVLLMALVLAARRGIGVDLVVPRRSNHRLADVARPAALRELLQAGARVWLTPQMLHAKLVVVDDSVAFCGSVNLDERSLFLNYEMMVAFYDPQAISGFAHWARRVREQSAPLAPAPVGVLREFGEGLLRWLTFQL